MKKMKKIVALMLAMAMAASMAACGGSSSTGTDTTASSGGADTTASAGETSGVPAGTNLNGETINIWYTTTATSVAETFVDLNPYHQFSHFPTFPNLQAQIHEHAERFYQQFQWI